MSCTRWAQCTRSMGLAFIPLPFYGWAVFPSVAPKGCGCGEWTVQITDCPRQSGRYVGTSPVLRPFPQPQRRAQYRSGTRDHGGHPWAGRRRPMATSSFFHNVPGAFSSIRSVVPYCNLPSRSGLTVMDGFRTLYSIDTLARSPYRPESNRTAPSSQSECNWHPLETGRMDGWISTVPVARRTAAP